MDREIKKPEILAPAGSFDSLRAAVAAGCDAVYIGGSKFGARAYADNPEGDEMLRAIEYCHLHNVKIYMTVNTLLKEYEIDHELYDYMKPYYEAGLDAAIVQDVGVLKKLHEWFPKLPLHASTQMTITMGKTTSILEKYGVNRIVPARELTIQELGRMREDTGLELEVFVHGALCYCYSGQCLFSSMLGGRSGNRGRCAQPCRMQYEIEEGKSDIGEYLLSPKELSNLSYVGEMIEAGIDSLKIEGRMKRPEYTALVTAMFRKYVDLYVELGKEKYSSYMEKHADEFQDDMRKLAELYNRDGFTQGYLEGRAGVPYEKRHDKRGVMLSSKRPKHGGVLIGEVTEVHKGYVVYVLRKDIHSQDVVEFCDDNMIQEYEYTIGTGMRAGEYVEARYKKGCIIREGDRVFRTKEAELLDDVRSKYLEGDVKIMMTGVYTAHVDEPAELSLTCGDISIAVTGDECQPAMKRAADDASVRKSICQTGNSEFTFEELTVDMDDNLFLPVGGLKNIRRAAIAKLRDAILAQHRRVVDASLLKEDDACEVVESVHTPPTAYDTEYIATVMTMEQLDAVLESDKFSRVYIKMELLNDNELADAMHKCQSQTIKAYLMMPHIFRTNVWNVEEKKYTEGKSPICLPWDGYVIRNFEEYVFLTQVAGVLPADIVTDAGLYIMNKRAHEFWYDQGCRNFTMPFELTSYEMDSIADIDGMQFIVYTHIPMMVSSQCVKFNTSECAAVTGHDIAKGIILKDQRTREFITVNYCKYCYNTIYQATPMILDEYESEILGKGIKYLRYDFTVEDASEVRNVIAGRYKGERETGHYLNGVQ